jgi:hypothetical protein
MIGLGTAVKTMDRTAEISGIPREPGTVVFQRSDETWIRINGKDKSNAFLEHWDGAKFVVRETPEKPTSPVDLLMLEFKNKGIWPPK